MLRTHGFATSVRRDSIGAAPSALLKTLLKQDFAPNAQRRLMQPGRFVQRLSHTTA